MYVIVQQEIFELDLSAIDSEHETLLRPNNTEVLEMKHLMLHHPKPSVKKAPTTDISKDASSLQHLHIVGSGSSTAINLTNLYTVPEVTAREEKSESIPSLLDRVPPEDHICVTALAHLVPVFSTADQVPPENPSSTSAQVPPEDLSSTPAKIPPEDPTCAPAVLTAPQVASVSQANNERKFRWSENFTSAGVGEFPDALARGNSASPKSPGFLSPEPMSPIWIAQPIGEENNDIVHLFANSQV